MVVHNDTLGDKEIIVQEIDTNGNHFIHAMITEDGWIASHGGDSSNIADTRVIEQIAGEMILSKDISSDSLSKIQNILKKYNYGHCFIKAPDGSYGIAYFETCVFGKLQPGEFLIVPNVYSGLRKGNYSDYGMDPVDAIVEICSYDNSGWNRRNLYSYDYKAHEVLNGQKYGLDIYVINDNGHNVGLNTSKIVTYCYFNDKKYSQTEIPQNPDKMHIGTYIFENQSIGSVFEVVDSPKNVLVNTESSICYRINNINDERMVVFDFDENVEFIGVEDVSQGDYSYNSGLHILFWNLPSSDISKEITLCIKPKVKGDYKIRSYVQGLDEENIVTGYATDGGVVLTSDNVTTYKSYYKSLYVYLTDDDGVPLIGEKISIMINGTTYYREVTPKGYATFAILLQPGEYDAVISYEGVFGKTQTTSKIIVKKTLFTNDLEVFYGETSGFKITCLDENGDILPYAEIDICIDGTLKNLFSDAKGTYNFDISKLEPGKHTIISYNIRTNEFVSNIITIKPATELTANAITATYNINKNLVITLKYNGVALSGLPITVSLNGVKEYITDNNGQIKVSTKGLIPKTYFASIKFAGYNNFTASSKSVKVVVKKASPKITAKAKSYKVNVKTKKYRIVLKNNMNKVMKNKKVYLKVKGKTYVAKTNSKGKATFKITKLTKKGKYAAVIKYKGDKYYKTITKKVKITVKK